MKTNEPPEDFNLFIDESGDLLGGGPASHGPWPVSETQQHDLPLRAPRPTTAAADQPPSLPPSLSHSTPALTGAGGNTPSSPLPGAASELPPGTVLANRYEIRRRLGSGGMGIVYAAFDSARGEEVAVKLLLPHLLGDAAACQRFVEEARIASHLPHPHIVRVHELQQAAGHTFLTMELLQGRSLRDAINQRSQNAQPFSIEEIRQVGRQLCLALQAAHQQIVHRDVKPENVWLCADGSVKLMDFGIARLLRPSQFTSNGLTLGTAYYMAPEQLKASKAIDHRADQYAVGVVLYELLTGEIPVGVVRAPAQVRQNVPAGLSEAVMKALAGNPTERHADMAAFSQALTSRRRSHRAARWLALAASLPFLIGAAATYPYWQAILRLTEAGTDPASKTEVEPGQRAERKEAPSDAEKAAKVEFLRRLGELDELRPRAERVEAELFAEEKVAREQVERCQRDLSNALDADKPEQKRRATERLDQALAAQALAADLADLWRKHPQGSDWRGAANGHLTAARTLAGNGAFVQALKELTQADALLRLPERWRDHAREALGLRQQARLAIRDRLVPLKTAPPALFAWPEKMLSEVANGLLQGDGAEGLASARRAADWLAQTCNLFELRRAVEEAAARASVATELPRFRDEHSAAVGALARADAALQAGRVEESRAAYETIRPRLTELAARANQYQEELKRAQREELAARQKLEEKKRRLEEEQKRNQALSLVGKIGWGEWVVKGNTTHFAYEFKTNGKLIYRSRTETLVGSWTQNGAAVSIRVGSSTERGTIEGERLKLRTATGGVGTGTAVITFGKVRTLAGRTGRGQWLADGVNLLFTYEFRAGGTLIYRSRTETLVGSWTQVGAGVTVRVGTSSESGLVHGDRVELKTETGGVGTGTATLVLDR